MNVLVLNSDFKTIGIIDSYESLIWTERYWEYGDFELFTSINYQELQLLVKDNYLMVNESKKLMIIEHVKLDSDNTDSSHLTVTGRSLESILDRRIIWSQTTISGNLQHQIKKLLTNNIINPTIPDRKISNFVFKNSSDTSITSLDMDSAQYTGDNLYDVISELCSIFEIGFRLYYEDSKIYFELFNGTDRSYNQTANQHIVFSPKYDNLISSAYETSSETYRNVVHIGGEGEGYDRKWNDVGSASGLNRRELFTDARDISSHVDGKTLTNTKYLALLKQRGIEDLSAHTIVNSFDASIDANVLYEYRKDYNTGDIIQIENEYGIGATARIMETVITEDENGYNILPTLQIIE